MLYTYHCVLIISISPIHRKWRMNRKKSYELISYLKCISMKANRNRNNTSNNKMKWTEEKAKQNWSEYHTSATQSDTHSLTRDYRLWLTLFQASFKWMKINKNWEEKFSCCLDSFFAAAAVSCSLFLLLSLAHEFTQFKRISPFSFLKCDQKIDDGL